MKLGLFLAISLSFPIEAAKPISGYGSRPIHFEPAGDAAYDYIARAANYTLLVNSREAQFRASHGHAVSMRLAGARHTAPAMPDKLPGVSHYYLGSDAEQWRTNVPHFSRVRWPQVYSGIDVVYYSRNREIEFDFEIAPGVDTSQIRLRFDGAEQLRINKDGALELTTPTGILFKRPPVAWQRTTNGKRKNIPVGYALENNEVTFALGPYNKRSPLTIDPSVAYATYLGGDGTDTPTGLAVDINGSAYLTGTTASNFFPGGGPRPMGTEIGFVTKLNPAGNGTVYSLYVNATPGAIAVDNNGTVYLSGHTSGQLAVKNAFQPLLAGLTDAFVAKFQPDGTLAFATYLGGTGAENGQVRGGVRIDPTGAVYVAGATSSVNFPVKNAFQPVHGGSQDAFVAKLDPSGSSLVFSTYIGGNAEEYPGGFDIEASRHPVLVGRTASTNYPVTPDAAQRFNGGFMDAFITRLNGSGQSVTYSTYFGGEGYENNQAVAAEAGGSVVFTGSGPDCVYLGCLQRLSANNQFSLLFKPTKANSAGMNNVSIDPFGNIVLTASVVQGFGGSTGGIPAVNPVRYQSTGDDAILMLLRPDGQIIFSTFWGGWVGSVSTSGSQNAIGAASDSSGALYLAGYTNATDLFASDNAFQPKVGGGQDAFFVKFAPGSQQIIASVKIDSQAPYTVDGVLYQSKRAFQWYAGTTHRIEIPENYQTTYARFSQGKWLDGGPNSRTITVGPTDGYYSASYNVEVKVEAQAVPAAGGMVSVAPLSPDGFYPAGTVVSFAAIPNPGYRFKQWTGSIITNGSTLSPTVYLPTPPGPFRMTANFEPLLTGTDPHGLVPITPCRIMDTRPEYGFPALFGAPALEAGVRTIPVPQGACGIPANASAYAINIAVIPLEPLSYLTAYPTGQPVPGTSTLNAADGRIASNGTIVKAGTSGAINLYATNRTHVIIDITGYFSPTAPAHYISFVTRCRALDTRQGTALIPGQIRQVSLLGPCGFPPSTKAALVSITAYPKGPLGWLSVSPTSPPATSILNAPQGQTRSTTVMIPINANAIPLQASDATDVTVDVLMYFQNTFPTVQLNPVTPCRAYDTRNGDGPILTANQIRNFSLLGRCGHGPSTAGYLANVTLIPATPVTALDLEATFAPISAPPTFIAPATPFPAPAGQPTAQMMMVQTTGSHQLQMRADGNTHVIIDVIGVITP